MNEFPPNGRYRIYCFYKQGFSPVTFWVASALNYRAAFLWIEENLPPRKKGRLYFVKALGSRYRWFEYDEEYDCQLNGIPYAPEPDPDEYYEVENEDDKTIIEVRGRERVMVRSVHLRS